MDAVCHMKRLSNKHLRKNTASVWYGEQGNMKASLVWDGWLAMKICTMQDDRKKKELRLKAYKENSGCRNCGRCEGR